MRSYYSRLCLLALPLVLCGCSSSHDETAPAASTEPRTYSGNFPIKVVATTGQVAELVSRIGGEHVEVQALMAPGVDPHLYRPIASDIKKLDEADAIVYNGLHLEGRMTEIFEQLAKRKVTYPVTSGLISRKDKRLRKPPEFADAYDPHVWHDVSMWSDCVTDVAEELAKFDPPHADQYRANAEKYRAELVDLDKYCKEEIAKIPTKQRLLVTAHDAFGYFGKAYGLEVLALKGISTEEEIDLAHQEEVQKTLVERKIPAVFVESAVAPRTVQALVEPCRAAGHDLQVPEQELYADALGPADTDDGTYAGMIRHNVKTIVDALSRE